jgi:hypothetical protein
MAWLLSNLINVYFGGVMKWPACGVTQRSNITANAISPASSIVWLLMKAAMKSAGYGEKAMTSKERKPESSVASLGSCFGVSA